MGLRILWSSNALWANTGYGVQAKSILPRLNALGHACAQHAWYGMQGGMMEANGIRIYPMAIDPFGSDIIGAHGQNWQADLIVSLMDIWVLPDDFAQRLRPAKWCCWFPIDMQPCPPRVAHMAARADYPLTYSRFGYEEAQRLGLHNVGYIPHGVETTVYTPGDKAAARAALGIAPDAFLCTMVAANKGMPSRKAFPENLQAFARFRARHPEALLYLHTVKSNSQGGINFDALVPACGLPPEAVRFVDQYQNFIGIPPEYLANVYRASDVLIASTQSEGFGIPIIEAQACGCPVITTNFTSMPELTVNGITTEPAQRGWTPLDSWVAIPSVERVDAALEEIYGWSPERRQELADCGVAHMRANYDWDVLVRDWWQPFLQRVEADIRGNNTGDSAARLVEAATIGV